MNKAKSMPEQYNQNDLLASAKASKMQNMDSVYETDMAQASEIGPEQLIRKDYFSPLEKKVMNRTRWLCYPQDKAKQLWDLTCGIALIVSCLTIPFYLAVFFYEEELTESIIINMIVDCCFFIDILVTFNTAIPVSQV